jgi:hypothetical protein
MCGASCGEPGVRAAGTDIWAVGSDSTGPLIEDFNGTSWSQVTAPRVSGGTLNGVSALSSNDVWAVGKSTSGPLVEFFNGTSWNVQTTPTVPGGGGSLNAVTAISSTDVWAVGKSSSGDLIEQFNGTSWSIVQAPSVGAKASLSGISAASPTDMFAVGSVTEEGEAGFEHRRAVAPECNHPTLLHFERSTASMERKQRGSQVRPNRTG